MENRREASVVLGYCSNKYRCPVHKWCKNYSEVIAIMYLKQRFDLKAPFSCTGSKEHLSNT
ncbi:hypothetical protein DPMN_175982 [Dreissena polymorpha]|uniref:Uncharacterized protein n=1 Tax=Dreissena polymorpha TaxID=45954 RepID=A0A9D4EA32_DREPO|nr:hypothetical protein DPMN_175982 [Dreissena polymorpha]